MIEKWFQETITNQKYELMLNMLITGEIEIFAGLFEEFVLNNLSYFDAAGKEPEKVYHAFVLGMLVSLSENYEVKSNKESGYAHIKKVRQYNQELRCNDHSKRCS